MGIAEIVALVTVLAPLAVQVLRLVNARLDNEKAQAVIRDAEKAIMFVEEVAAANPELAKKGKAKLDDAVSILARKHPNLPIVEAKQVITATLPKLGIGATTK